MQYVDAGDISELVAGFSSICLQRQNKGVACEIEYSTCFLQIKNYLSVNICPLTKYQVLEFLAVFLVHICFMIPVLWFIVIHTLIRTFLQIH